MATKLRLMTETADKASSDAHRGYIQHGLQIAKQKRIYLFQLTELISWFDEVKIIRIITRSVSYYVILVSWLHQRMLIEICMPTKWASSHIM